MAGFLFMHYLQTSKVIEQITIFALLETIFALPEAVDELYQPIDAT